MNRLHPPILAALALAVSACATTPYSDSQLDGRRYHTTNIDTYPVLISKVDGVSPPLRENPVRVQPGKRSVVVEAPPGGALRQGDSRTIELDVAPCTRYYLVAQKTSRLASDFEVRIDHREPVSGCTPPKA